ncbi:MAG: glutaminyl-peptide cyclotransferase [Desulfobacterales bacterium]|nr:glutaminyl-peptide cyclotransferase [Deltaproteobacteria bacterium]NNK94397.1 glutaminyl-peptide cyclotransferase [Desulfobacterales bacterium]
MLKINSILRLIALLTILCLSIGCAHKTDTNPEKYTYRIVNSYPHDPEAFTQGLAWDKGFIFEGTGIYGHSSLRKQSLQTGRTEHKIDYQDDIFAEGVTVFDDKIYQLTWKNRLVFIYDKHDLSLIKKLNYPREGWGITHDSHNLIVSDGSSTLYFIDPETLTEVRRITVQQRSRTISALNELEYINGSVYANIWKSNRIVIISPSNGEVEGWIDLSGLDKKLSKDNSSGVLNGIMFDPDKQRLFVTGKLWPTLFEIELVKDT